MVVIGNTVVLLRDELSPVCVKDPAWAAKLIRLYGVDAEYRGRLKSLSKCEAVLTAAGYTVRIVDSPTEEEQVVSELKAKVTG